MLHRDLSDALFDGLHRFAREFRDFFRKLLLNSFVDPIHFRIRNDLLLLQNEKEAQSFGNADAAFVADERFDFALSDAPVIVQRQVVLTVGENSKAWSTFSRVMGARIPRVRAVATGTQIAGSKRVERESGDFWTSSL